MVDESVDNNQFATHALPSSDVSYTANGLNQYTGILGFTQDYDANGNLSVSRQSDGSGGTLTTTYVYDTENRLVSVSGGNTADLYYDPFGRLYRVTDGVNSDTRFHYDGDALVGEYNASGTMLNRYAHGPGAGDDPLVRYPGTSISHNDAQYLYTDRLGSITLEANRYGTISAINTYDDYGVFGPVGATQRLPLPKGPASLVAGRDMCATGQISVAALGTPMLGLSTKSNGMCSGRAIFHIGGIRFVRIGSSLTRAQMKIAKDNSRAVERC